MSGTPAGPLDLTVDNQSEPPPLLLRLLALLFLLRVLRFLLVLFLRPPVASVAYVASVASSFPFPKYAQTPLVAPHITPAIPIAYCHPPNNADNV